MCKEVAPKRRKTALRAIASLANIAQIPTRIPTSKPLAVYAAAEAAVCAVAAPTMAKLSPPDRLPEQLHIPIIQHAVRAIFWRVTRKASVRENLPPRDRHLPAEISREGNPGRLHSSKDEGGRMKDENSE